MLIIKKFGGTSLATVKHIMHLASLVREDILNNNRVVVVVSAMNKTTDELINLANDICKKPNKRELDMLLTTGERVSMSLFSMALNSLGIKSCSFTGSQVGIITSSSHNNANIINIKGERLKKAIEHGITPVIAGYQGISVDKEITTLGRGGSDTTAVALAAYLNADICEIYTDVNGVYTVDPQIVYNAKHIDEISYEEMLVMASRGARVLHPRSVEIARKYNIKLCVKSSFNEGEGTMIKNMDNIEQTKITGISYKEDLSILNIQTDVNINDILKKLMEHKLSFLYFMHKSKNQLSFILENNSINDILTSIEELSESISINNDICIITIIGIAINNNDSIINSIMNITKGISSDILSIIKNELSISIITKRPYLEKIVKDLSEHFNLEK